MQSRQGQPAGAFGLRADTSVAGWVDLRQCGREASGVATADPDGVLRLGGQGWALAARGRFAAVCRDGDVVCAAAGTPRFDAPVALRAAAEQGAAAAWIALYREAGPDFVRRARGAWSVIVVDLERRAAVAAVDRFAVRPLCYRFADGLLAFATRADEVPGAGEAIDWQSVYDYVYPHIVPAPRPIFDGVSRLDAAHRLAAGGAGVQVERHWQPRFAPREVPFGERKEAFLSALAAAVSDRLGDEAVGCYLSGGTDSSTVAGMVTRVTGKPARTFSIGFDADGYDEMHYARVAARHFGAEHREYYVTPQDLVELIPVVAAFYDQPIGNLSALPAYYCAREARREGITRMLAGDGGDELFGGNSRYAADRIFTAYERIPGFVRSALIEPLALGLPLRSVPLARKAARYVEIARMPVPDRMQLHNLLTRIGPGQVFTPDFLARVDTGEPRQRELATWAATPEGATLDRTLAWEWKYVLADNDLPKVVGTATLGGVDVAFPMLDERLVDFSLTLPPALKVRGHRLRYFFKKALEGFLPDEVITKKKHGFGLPFGVWMLRTPALREVAHEAVEALERRGVIRPGLRNDLFDRKVAEHAGYYGEMIWVLMMLELWLGGRRAGSAPSPGTVPPARHAQPAYAGGRDG